mgnify:FL=1
MENSQPNVSQNTVQTYPAKSTPRLYIIVAMVALLLIVLGILLLVLNYLKIISLSSFVTSLTVQKTNIPVSAPTSTLQNSDFLLNINSAAIDSVAVSYSLRNVKIGDVKDNGTRITIHSPNDPNLKVPELILDKNTRVLTGGRNAPIAMEPSNLKIGDNAYILFKYDIKKSLWSVVILQIAPDSPRSATDSAGPTTASPRL